MDLVLMGGLLPPHELPVEPKTYISKIFFGLEGVA